MQQRSEAINGFLHGTYQIIVATDVIGRGLNLPKVGLIVNYDMPKDDDLRYIHRIGRTGRVGNLGRAISFFDPDSQDFMRAGFYVQVLKDVNQEVPEFLRKYVEDQEEANREVLKSYNKNHKK
ncbi:putative ATP-dependent RNA helicase vasa-like [Ditylenchus destructor]|nr:putative ATP-dependent RNA helicase vasa-like [Ditylenchus destructor]